MKKTKKLVAILSAATMALTSLTAVALSASAATNEQRIPYMLGDANNDYYVNAIDASIVMSTLHDHGLQRGMAVSVSYVQKNLSDWFPEAACAVAVDANKDGYISYEDADEMMEYYANASTGGSGETDIGKMFLYIG